MLDRWTPRDQAALRGSHITSNSRIGPSFVSWRLIRSSSSSRSAIGRSAFEFAGNPQRGQALVPVRRRLAPLMKEAKGESPVTHHSPLLSVRSR